MIYTKLTKLAMRLCFERHCGQEDRSGVPYPFHPFHVAESMDDETGTCVALLHDILEDTDTTAEELTAMGFSAEMVEAVELMTHDERVPYVEYVERIRQNPVARRVKIADLTHNMDLTRLDTVTEKDLQRVTKYAEALKFLRSE